MKYTKGLEWVWSSGCRDLSRAIICTKGLCCSLRLSVSLQSSPSLGPSFSPKSESLVSLSFSPPVSPSQTRLPLPSPKHNIYLHAFKSPHARARILWRHPTLPRPKHWRGLSLAGHLLGKQLLLTAILPLLTPFDLDVPHDHVLATTDTHDAHLTHAHA